MLGLVNQECQQMLLDAIIITLYLSFQPSVAALALNFKFLDLLHFDLVWISKGAGLRIDLI